MAVDEKALRATVAETTKKVDKLRQDYRSKPTKAVGRQLFNARRKASEALKALWAEFPDEKPPSQHLL